MLDREGTFLGSLRSCALALLFLALAFAGRSALDLLWGNKYPFVLFVVAVFVSAQLAGARPAILTLLGGFLLADWFFVAPRHSLLISDLNQMGTGSVYLLLGGLIIYFSSRTRRAFGRELMNRRRLQSHANVLEEARAQFQHLFENSPAATWVEDWSSVVAWMNTMRSQGVTDLRAYFRERPERIRQALGLIRILDANQAAMGLLRAASKEELLARRPSLFSDAVCEQLVEGLIAAWNNQAHIQHESQLLRLDGRAVHLLFSVDVPRHLGRETLDFSRIIVAATDITERKLAEQKLLEQERYYRSLIENSSDVISIVDEEGVICYQGPSARDAFGFSPEEMVGHHAWDFVHPEDRAALQRDCQKAFSSPERGGRTVFRHRHKDGSWRIVETVGRQLPFPGPGNKRWHVVNVRDITERRRLEEENARLAAIVQSSEDAIVGEALDGTILSWNPGAERLYGFSAREAVGATTMALIGPAESQELQQARQRVRAGEHISHLETALPAKNGRLVEVSLSISPVLNASGQIVGISTIGRDIRAHKQAEREQERLLRQWQQALAEVKTLSGLLPICSHCKKIRDDHGYWNQIEHYIIQHSSANFSHGICPECAQKLYPQLYQEKVLKGQQNLPGKP